MGLELAIHLEIILNKDKRRSETHTRTNHFLIGRHTSIQTTIMKKQRPSKR